MMYFLLPAAALVIAIVIGIPLAFGSADHSSFDHPRPPNMTHDSRQSAAQFALIADITQDRANTPKMGRRAMLQNMRAQMDARGLAHQIDSTVVPVDTGGIKGEWIIAKSGNPARRMLYIHGGAYMVGSPHSHRLIAHRMAKALGGAVFMVAHRLLPEHRRIEGITDVRNAYTWLHETGPKGAGSAETVIIAGDSSGGNIALSLAAWARDTGQPRADAVIAYSPQTDLTLASPSLIANTSSDVMQGDSFGPIVRAPRFMRLFFMLMMHRTRPNDPLVSPLLGELAGLPPTLIQASASEMFLDDVVRYANKARANGTDVTLQIWPNMLHVWQAFDIPEAEAAFAEVAQFLNARAQR